LRLVHARTEIVRVGIAIAALLVLAMSIAIGAWWVLVAVGAVLFGAFFWRPRVREARARADVNDGRTEVFPLSNMLGVLAISPSSSKAGRSIASWTTRTRSEAAVVAAVLGTCFTIWAPAVELGRRRRR
jgi:hypothetical protein